ncbi:hypothetical protein [Wenyingzhuangia marina]|uniref:Uncharacterized protein n=1 Tax=Wenyingzhuangia marina TaxID=1195760 RepID=A0A1M5V8F3_9FLAO|nr:hypothetical protein [Wenyingzhuangia marina]GGF73697.1 hypothetical protein GCM10011397_15780 [Wenyingzhuangia marina]SHH71542.1 hypothetical protein SAMN05444281_1601 [Wenyingzhuangia marina]
MKKSNYILITSVLFILIFITVYFVDTKIHKEEIRSEIIESANYINFIEEIKFLKKASEKDPTNHKKWEEFMTSIEKLIVPRNIHLYNNIDLLQIYYYVHLNYKKFNDTSALNTIAKLYNREYKKSRFRRLYLQ